MSTTRVDVAVVGGGIAGLVAAATAARAGASVTLLERAEGAGRATTDERGGFLLNRGAHAFYAACAGAQVLDRLGVHPIGTAPPSKGSLALTRDGVDLLPVGATSLARTGLLGVRDKARLGALLARLPRLDPGDLVGRSVEDWFSDAGIDGRAADVLRALVRVSTYAAATELLPAGVAVQQLQAGLADGVRYLDGGWGRMAGSIRSVAEAAGTTSLAAAVRSVEAAGDAVEVVLDDGRTIVAGAVVIAAGPPTVAAALLPGGAPAAWASAGPEVAAGCLDLGLIGRPPRRFLLGVDEPVYFSVHHPPADLAPAGGSVADVMRYLHPDEDTADPARAKAALAAVADAAGVRDEDIAVSRHLHRMVVTGGMPTVEHGGLAGRPPVALGDGVFVAGDWVGPTGLLVDAAAASGEAAGLAASRTAAAAQVSR